MATLRTAEMRDKYRALIAERASSEECFLCSADALRTFKLWKIIANNFPYDRIAAVHHMIVPLRHVGESGLSKEEKTELFEIKKSYIEEKYQFILEATDKTKSIPTHYHLHLITVKDFQDL